MSNRALTWAFSQRLGGRASEKLVLLDLADHADDNDRAWPRMAYIAERTELSEATVLRAIKQLIEWGLVEKLKRRSQIGRPRANLYTLRLDRDAPLELAQPTVTMTVSDDDDSENTEETRVSDESGAANRHPASLHSDSHMGCTMTVTNRTLNSEPSSLNPRRKPKPARPPDPEPVSQAEKPEAVTDRFERTCGAYQRQNVLFALGDVPAARKLFRKKSVDDQIAIVAAIDNVLKGAKAQFARWKNAPETERGTKPKVPSLRAVIGFELWKDAGVPSEPGPAATLSAEHIELCREIAKNSTFGTIWIVAGSPRWNAWHGFFKLHGQGMPMRRANFSDCYDAKAEKGTDGWRFPSDFPPAAGDAHADPPTRSPMRAETDEMADFH